MEVRPIKYDDCLDWFLKKHYAKRIPPISYAFGLYVDGILMGVVSYGVPASSSLINGICGEDLSEYIFELNRLVINSNSPKNSASYLIGNSIKQLPKNSVIVSYADTSKNHNGYVYQAANFLYTGLSAKRTDWKIKGLEHLHGQTIADKSRGFSNRSQYMRDTYGEDFYLEERSRKHRYVYFKNKKMQKYLKYNIHPYPKNESKKYECIDITTYQGLLF